MNESVKTDPKTYYHVGKQVEYPHQHDKDKRDINFMYVERIEAIETWSEDGILTADGRIYHYCMNDLRAHKFEDLGQATTVSEEIGMGQIFEVGMKEIVTQAIGGN